MRQDRWAAWRASAAVAGLAGQRTTRRRIAFCSAPSGSNRFDGSSCHRAPPPMQSIGVRESVADPAGRLSAQELMDPFPQKLVKRVRVFGIWLSLFPVAD